MVYLMLSLLSFTSIAHAQTAVQFTAQDLNAGLVLFKPERNNIEINELKGTFDPSPELRVLGVSRQVFDIDPGIIANVVGLKFNHVKAKAPIVRFGQNTIEIDVPVLDQGIAVQSNLGTIGLKNVVLTAVVGWKAKASGEQELVLLSDKFVGSLYGTGVLRNRIILRKLRGLLMNILANQMNSVLAEPGVIDAVKVGMLQWAKFSIGSEPHSIVPGSCSFDVNGLKYQVQ